MERTNHTIGLIRDRSLVDDRVKNGRFEIAMLTPDFRKNMVDIERDLLKIEFLDGSLPKEVLGPLAK
jgi:hypothetical protein